MSLSTIPHNDRRVQYAASAGQIEFWFDFPLARALDLSVTRQRDGVLEALSQERDYHVTAMSSTGGTIRLSEGAQADDIIEVFGDRTVERTANFAARGDFSAKAVNDEFNNIYIILQELKQQHDDFLAAASIQAPMRLTDGVFVLAQDEAGRTVRLDMSSFIGEKGDVGPIGPRGSVPSVIAEAQNGCVVGNIDGGFFGEDFSCSDAAIFDLSNAPANGVLGWKDYNFEILETDGFKGEKGDRGEHGLPGPRGSVPSVIAEADNGAYVGTIDGGYFGENSGNISGNIFSLEAKPGIMGFDADGKAKLFGYNEFKGPQGVAGPVGPHGPRGSVPSVIAEAQNGAIVGNIDGGWFGENASASGAIFSTVSAQNISYNNNSLKASTVQAALDALESGKAGRNDGIDAGAFGQGGAVRPSAKIDTTSKTTTTENIDGGLF